MVLNDGETYTDLTGCKVVHVDTRGLEDYESEDIIVEIYQNGKTEHGSVVAEFNRDGLIATDISSQITFLADLVERVKNIG
jgi:hypothetical protein